MRKVLILGVAPVQMEAIETLKEMSVETYACAMKNDGPGAKTADHFDVIDFLDMDKVTDYIKENNIDAVYSVGSDSAMPVVGAVSKKLSLPYLAPPEVAKTCNDKGSLRTKLGSDCKSNLPYQIIDHKDTELKVPYPFVMKPVDSQGQRGIVLVRDYETFYGAFDEVRQYSRSGNVIVEQYVPGFEVSVNAYVVDGEVRFLLVSDRVTWPMYTGLIHKHVIPSRKVTSKTQDLIREAVSDGCRRTGIKNGPAYFQMKVEKEIPYIIEMTPRLDGCHMWKLIRYYTGMNLLKLTFEHLLDNNISELDKVDFDPSGYVLEFFCQEPDTLMDRAKFTVSEEALEHYYYYKTSERIRPINGKYDKVGYQVFRD